MRYHFELSYKKGDQYIPLFKSDFETTLQKYIEQLTASGISEEYQINKVVTSYFNGD
jgi:hypothetical protein